jgi:hypothetical protein
MGGVGMEARCVVCGKRPAKLIKVERNVGMVVLRTAHHDDGPFCREHALAAAKKNLGLTMVTGWWGVKSFVLNFKAIATDVAAIKSARGLAPSGDEDADAG